MKRPNAYDIKRFSDPHLNSVYKNLGRKAILHYDNLNNAFRIEGLCNECSAYLRKGKPIKFYCRLPNCADDCPKGVCHDGSNELENEIKTILEHNKLMFRLHTTPAKVHGSNGSYIVIGSPYLYPGRPSYGKHSFGNKHRPNPPHKIKQPKIPLNYEVVSFGDHDMNTKYQQFKAPIIVKYQKLNNKLYFNYCNDCSSYLRSNPKQFYCRAIMCADDCPKTHCPGGVSTVEDYLVKIFNENKVNFRKKLSLGSIMTVRTSKGTVNLKPHFKDVIQKPAPTIKEPTHPSNSNQFRYQIISSTPLNRNRFAPRIQNSYIDVVGNKIILSGICNTCEQEMNPKAKQICDYRVSCSYENGMTQADIWDQLRHKNFRKLKRKLGGKAIVYRRFGLRTVLKKVSLPKKLPQVFEEHIPPFASGGQDDELVQEEPTNEYEYESDPDDQQYSNEYPYTSDDQDYGYTDYEPMHSVHWY
ncbi:MAG: hypothetical protein P0S93_06240 [Candidatus Neptunochlamydia sp.]|nr:hypothetical protein [Candidatus Neptunochlamydia sp.]